MAKPPPRRRQLQRRPIRRGSPFDFPDTGNGLGATARQLNAGDLRSVNIVQVGDRTRLVLNLSRLSPYDVRSRIAMS